MTKLSYDKTVCIWFRDPYRLFLMKIFITISIWLVVNSVTITLNFCKYIFFYASFFLYLAYRFSIILTVAIQFTELMHPLALKRSTCPDNAVFCMASALRSTLPAQQAAMNTLLHGWSAMASK